MYSNVQYLHTRYQIPNFKNTTGCSPKKQEFAEILMGFLTNVRQPSCNSVIYPQGRSYREKNPKIKFKPNIYEMGFGTACNICFP
jgi:hypothetical protein